MGKPGKGSKETNYSFPSPLTLIFLPLVPLNEGCYRKRIDGWRTWLGVIIIGRLV